MFLNAGGYSQDVGIKDDVVTIESNFLNQNVVGSGANLHFPWRICCLKVKQYNLAHEMHYKISFKYPVGSKEWYYYNNFSNDSLIQAWIIRKSC